MDRDFLQLINGCGAKLLINTVSCGGIVNKGVTNTDIALPFQTHHKLITKFKRKKII